MTVGRRRALAFVLAFGGQLASIGCDGGNDPGRRAESASLGGDVVAKVGAVTIGRELVASVAREQNIAPREAAQKLVDDAVAAEAARRRGLDRDVPARWALVAARARLLADHYRDEALAEGPPTPAELAEVADRHWREVDRPPSVRVVHALVKRPADASKTAEARALAESLAARLRGSPTPEEFEARAKSFAVPRGVDVVVEKLPPFTEDGYVVDAPSRMDEAFARAAYAIDAPGHQTGVVESAFGFHVIHLVERLPEQRMPLESRRVAFADEILSSRARRRVEAALEAQRQKSPPAVLPSAEGTMLEVHRDALREPRRGETRP